MLNLRATLNDGTGARYVDAQAANGLLYTITTQPRFRAYNLSTLQEMASSTALVSTPSGLALLSGGASAVVTSSGSSQVDLVQLSTGYRTLVTTGANTTVSNVINQQVAPGLSNKAVSTRATTGTVQRIDASPSVMTVTSVTVAALSGQTARCIIPTGDGRYFIGTSDGKIHTINDTGFTYQTITLPNTPNVSTPTFHVASLSYYDPYILATTTQGMAYLWNYSSSAIVSTQMVGTCDYSNVTCPLSMNASGMAVMGRSLTPGNSWSDISEVYFEKGAITFPSVFFNEINLAYNNVGLDPSTWICWEQANTTTANYQLRTFDITPNNKIQVETAIQKPQGTYVGGDIIRIRDDGIGRTVVESDQTIGASATLIPASEGHNYIEIAITTTPEFDVRQFLA